MTSRVTEIIVDSHDPLTIAGWWAEVLGYEVLPMAPEGWVGISPWPPGNERPSDDAFRAAPQLPTIVFVPVPEAKIGKNRIHLDIWSVDRSQAEEVAWLESRGAIREDIGQGDVPWVVMADPEGNVFCVMG
ncbi:MAG: VOC family protein [Candidatus Dormibacteria bacterium]